jgi:uncharacterized protein (TIGR02594 family)
MSIRWYNNPSAQALISVGVFMGISAILFGLVMLYSSYITAYRNEKTKIVVNINPENLLQASRVLKTDSHTLSPPEREQSTLGSEHLESAAGEMETPQQFTLHSTTSSAPLWLQFAFNQLSQKEIAGEKHNQNILRYISSIESNIPPSALTDEIPWVSSFVNWAIERARIVGTNHGDARSWLAWGRGINKPKPGAIAIFKMDNHPEEGYVGFFLSETPHYIIVLGGDFGNAVRIISMKKSNLLGYRWPTSG